MEESKRNIKQENTDPLNLSKWKSIMLYFQDNLIHIQTNSDQLSSKNTPTHTEVPNTFLDDGDSSCIYDITAMIRATTENNLKTLIAKRLGVEIISYCQKQLNNIYS